MPNSTVPAADEGLPNVKSASGLVDRGSSGIAIARSALPAQQTAIFAGADLTDFLSQMDTFASVVQWREQTIATMHGRRGKLSARRASELDLRFEHNESWEHLKEIRKGLWHHIRRIREVPSKTIDDVLFKCYAADILDTDAVRSGVCFSVVRDLLGAECQWRA